MNERLAELEKRLADQDWHYERSDDHNVFSKGAGNWNAICRLKRELATMDDMGAIAEAMIQKASSKPCQVF